MPRKNGNGYGCPNPDKPYTLWELIDKVEKDPVFAQFFAAQIVSANAGNYEALLCVESYLQPTTEDLQGLGIHVSQWGSMRKCTDVGLLVLVTCKQKAPDPFP